MRHALKQAVRRCVPVPVLRWALTRRSKWIARRYRTTSPQKIFSEIYANNRWGSGESVSGPGSEIAATRNISLALPRLIRRYDIHSVLDAPCGDFHWMQKVDLANVEYIGGDIVEELIGDVSRRFSAPNRRFLQLDLVQDPLPLVDLIFCRDCFIHLPFRSIHQALASFARSGAKYVLLTTFLNQPVNYDTTSGGARAIDLCAWPFNLTKPLELIQEEQPGTPGAPYKCMGLWSTRSLLAGRSL